MSTTCSSPPSHFQHEHVRTETCTRVHTHTAQHTSGFGNFLAASACSCRSRRAWSNIPCPPSPPEIRELIFLLRPHLCPFPSLFLPHPLSCPKRSRRATGGQAGPDGQCAQKRVAAQAVEQRVSAVAAAAGRLAGHCQRCVRIEFARACRMGRTVCADSIGSFAAGKTLTLKANEDASRCRQVRIPHTQLRTRQRQRNMPILIAPSHPPLHHV